MRRRELLTAAGAALMGMGIRPFGTYAQGGAQGGKGAKVFRAGAFAQDITPEYFPIAVNGGFSPRYAKKALDPLHARCLVLDDGAGQIVMAVVDSCVLDREIMDETKQIASRLTGIPASRIFISATHTHSAPATVSLLGTDREQRYRDWLPGKIAEVSFPTFPVAAKIKVGHRLRLSLGGADAGTFRRYSEGKAESWQVRRSELYPSSLSVDLRPWRD